MIDLTKYELKPIYKDNVLHHYGLVPKVERRAYKQGWDSAGGELTDVKEQIEAVLDRIENSPNGAYSGTQAHMMINDAIRAERNRLKEEK